MRCDMQSQGDRGAKLLRGFLEEHQVDSSSASSGSSCSSSDEDDETVALGTAAVEERAICESMSMEEIEDYRRSEMGVSVTKDAEEHSPRTLGNSANSSAQDRKTGVMRKLLSRVFGPTTPRRLETQHLRASEGGSLSASYSSSCASVGGNDLNASLKASFNDTSPKVSRVAAAGVSVNISELKNGRGSSSSGSESYDSPLISKV